MSQPNILIVEDEQITAMEVQKMLEEIDYEVSGVVDTGQQAIEMVDSEPVDLVIMDIRLDGPMDGIEATRKIKQSHDKIPVIYFSAYSDDKTLEGAKNTEPAGFLIKPITKEDLRSSIEVALGSV